MISHESRWRCWAIQSYRQPDFDVLIILSRNVYCHMYKSTGWMVHLIIQFLGFGYLKAFGGCGTNTTFIMQGSERIVFKLRTQDLVLSFIYPLFEVNYQIPCHSFKFENCIHIYKDLTIPFNIKMVQIADIACQINL